MRDAMIASALRRLLDKHVHFRIRVTVEETLWMKGKTDMTVGRATAARRGVGRVHHLDARLSWLQRLWAEGVMESQFRLGEHNEADLESKMIDSTLLLKGTPLRPPFEFIELELTDGGSKFPRD